MKEDNFTLLLEELAQPSLAYELVEKYINANESEKINCISSWIKEFLNREEKIGSNED